MATVLYAHLWGAGLADRLRLVALCAALDDLCVLLGLLAFLGLSSSLQG